LPESYNSLADLAHGYHEFMKDLGVDKYSIVGLSVGGMWGAHLANLYKEEVTGLIIMDSYLAGGLRKRKLSRNILN